MSQKGISPCYDSYLRLLDIPSKYNLKLNYKQGKITAIVPRARQQAMQENTQTVTEIVVDDNGDEVEELGEQFTPMQMVILIFLDTELLQGHDADVFINSAAPEELSIHATNVQKTDRVSLNFKRNHVNKLFNSCINLPEFKEAHIDIDSPLTKFNLYPVLMEYAVAIKDLLINECNMIHVKQNKLFDRLHETLKTSRHNAITRR